VLARRGNLLYTDRHRLGFIDPGNLQLKWSEGVAAHTEDAQSVSGGTVNILGGGSIEYSE